MPRDHGRVFVSIWADDDFTNLTSDAQRRYIQLLTQERVNAAGILDMFPSRWARSSRTDSLDQVQADLAELAREQYIVFDTDTSELLIRSFMRGDRVWKIPNSTKSALTAAGQVQSRKLRQVLVGELRRLADLIPEGRNDPKSNREAVLTAADLLEQSLRKGSGNPSANGSSNPSPNPSDLGPLRQAENASSAQVSEPLGQGLTEPFPEPLTEPLGVGVGVGEVVSTTSSVVASKQQTTPRPTAAELAATATDPRTAVVLGAWRNSHTERYTNGIYSRIGAHVAAALASGITEDTVTAALSEWDRRGNAKPGLLPHLIDDAVHAKHAGTTKTAVVNGKPTMPVDQIPDDAINPDEILGQDYWTLPAPPRAIEGTPAEDEWVAQQVADRKAQRVAEARRALIKRQNRSSA